VNWPIVQLRRIARLGYGSSLSEAVREEGDVPVYGSNGQVGTHTESNTSGPVLIIGRKGSFGKVRYCEWPVFAIDTTFYVDQRLSSSNLRWLFYVLQVMNLDALSEDVGVPGLSRENVYRQVIPLPPTITQDAIADYLDHETERIDSLIAARQNMVVLLEEHVALAFEYAVRQRGFEFPAQLDPDWAEWPRPKHWAIMHLSQVLVQLTNGFVGPTRDILRDDGVPYIQSLHIKNGRIDFERRPFFVEPQWHEARPRIHLREEDVLIVQTGDIGQVAVVPPHFGAASCHALQIARVKRALISGSYLAAYLRSPFGRHSLLSRATGALHPHLEAGIKGIPVVVPPLDAQEGIVQEVAQAEVRAAGMLSMLHRQAQLLQERRQALITAAVTGELDISEAA
jgi:type I restriction enzyme, S subunit